MPFYSSVNKLAPQLMYVLFKSIHHKSNLSRDTKEANLISSLLETAHRRVIGEYKLRHQLRHDLTLVPWA